MDSEKKSPQGPQSLDDTKKKLEVAQSTASIQIQKYVSTAIKTAEADLLSNVTDNMPEPFDIRQLEDKSWRLSLPTNIEDYDRLLFRQIIALANHLKVHIVGTTQGININKETPGEKDFFFGFFKMLHRQPIEGENFSFNFDSASARGAAQCKLIIMQKTLKGLYADVSAFLPRALFTEKGGKRLELELSAIAISSKSNTQRLLSCIVKLIDLWLPTTNGAAWAALVGSYMVSVPLILDGLHRTVTEKGPKGKDRIRTKKPKRPSKRIEILSPIEAKLIKGCEKAFDDYKAKIKSLGKEIKISDIKATRDTLKGLIVDMWTCVEKFSAPLTKRRTILTEHLTESDRKRLNFNKQYMDMLRANHFSVCTHSKNHVYTLSPIQILLKADNMNAIYTNKIVFEQRNIVVPEDLPESIKDIFLEFASTIGFSASKTVAPKKTHRIKHTATGSNWSDDEEAVQQIAEISKAGQLINNQY
jgi:hypothetical protein